MVTTFSGWLCNMLLSSAIIATGALTYQTFIGPVVNEMNTLIALGASAVLSLLRPRL